MLYVALWPHLLYQVAQTSQAPTMRAYLIADHKPQGATTALTMAYISLLGFSFFPSTRYASLFLLHLVMFLVGVLCLQFSKLSMYFIKNGTCQHQLSVPGCLEPNL